MISLELGPRPPVLEGREAEWGIEYETAVSAGTSIPTRYKNDQIKEALRAETLGKCAYCESLIEHVSFSHIEHIVPKSHTPRLVCTWTNLTLACPVCNNNKGAFFSDETPLLNPYVDEVEQEISFWGPMAIHRTDRARVTISVLKLNRAELLFRRHQKLDNVLKLLDLLVETEGNPAYQTALLEDLKDRISESDEYTNCSRCFSRDEVAKRGLTLEIAMVEA